MQAERFRLTVCCPRRRLLGAAVPAGVLRDNNDSKGSFQRPAVPSVT